MKGLRAHTVWLVDGIKIGNKTYDVLSDGEEDGNSVLEVKYINMKTDHITAIGDDRSYGIYVPFTNIRAVTAYSTARKGTGTDASPF